MPKNQKGMTLVEVLATLILLSLVAGVIWTTVSIASQFNISETSNLRLQQEANYIISQLQQVHRNCFTYDLTISKNEVRVDNCMEDKVTSSESYNGVISNQFNYLPILDHKGQTPTKTDLNLSSFKVTDPERAKRFVEIPTIISRYKTEK
ncbi:MULTISPECIES: PilW family protein [unclassified Sporosarcina]|uniref:PilW family protein n=1 Tax=unclassified Sporosarcina TaxID=2647733 RepID=UPI00203AEDC8|nr:MULTISPECIES: prepilin-type N-terminal cleavage/methylation domain-containing protein [unclassified Sporosarcina]GKV66540.1 hypothetical protein NCCP2331_26930 [Sporosarcina sp. NCCP-2331]GLB56817.1 hypothetical protein NCCP2378_26040 [Sporosarcina sp. NCCP-2378]